MKASLKGLPNKLRGSAWPSSARTVKRTVKSVNERDPYPYLPNHQRWGEHYKGTASDKEEEGAGDGRSVCSESLGLHAAYNGINNGLQSRKGKPIPQIMPWFGSRVVTHPREAEIPSNRWLPSSGEYVPAPCTHRPSNQSSKLRMRLHHPVDSSSRFARGVKS